MNSKILINNIKQLPSDPRLNNVLKHLCIQMQEKLQGLQRDLRESPRFQSCSL